MCCIITILEGPTTYLCPLFDFTTSFCNLPAIQLGSLDKAVMVTRASNIPLTNPPKRTYPCRHWCTDTVGLAPPLLSFNHSTNNNQHTFNIKSIYFPHLPDHRLPKRRQRLPSRTLPWERGLVKTGEVFSPMPGSLRQREVMAGW